MERQRKVNSRPKSGMADMTQGSPVRHVLIFAIPLFIGNIFQQIYNIVDTMVAGYNLGDQAIAAIGATSSLYGLLVNFAWGLNSGFGIVVARKFGAKDEEGLKSSIAAMMILNTVMTALISVGALFSLRLLMRGLKVPGTIFEDAYDYLVIIVAGMIVTILYNMCAGILRAVGNSRTPLYFLIISSILNLVIDVLFIMGFGWGVQGAAAATVIAEGVSALLAGGYIMRYYQDILPKKRHFRFERPLLQEMLGTGFSMAVMLCVVDFGSVLYQRAINGLGDTLIVAHTAARKIIGILMMPLSSIATANSTFVSQNFGAKQYGRIEESIRKDPALGILLALRTSLQAMGSKVVPVISSGFELAGKVVAGFVLIPAFGYLWVCLTEPIIWVVCMGFLILVFAVRNPLKKAMEQEQAEKGECHKKGICLYAS